MADILKYTHPNEHELWVGTFDPQGEIYVWERLIYLRQKEAVKSTPTPAPATVPSPEPNSMMAHLCKQMDNANLQLQTFEAGIKKLQNAVEHLEKEDKETDTDIIALTNSLATVNMRMGELEKRCFTLNSVTNNNALSLSASSAKLEHEREKLASQLSGDEAHLKTHAETIKKLQDEVDWLKANNKVITEVINTLGLWKVHTDSRVGELEKKAIIAAQLEAKTEKGLLLLEGDIGRRTQELSERVSQLESNTEMECAPWCTKQGHHTICSPAPPTPPTPGNPGETARREVFQDWHMDKGACNCDIGVRHTHWNRLPVGIKLKPGPLPCRPGCIFKPPHEGTSCVVLE